MTASLFVYGSLVSAAKHPKGDRLRRESVLLGSATLQARLYRVSWYPGIELSADLTDVVHGEVYRLATPDQSLRWLDEYEGLTPGATSVAPTDDYERRLCRVQMSDGKGCEAWVYLYRRDTRELERVVDGRWRG